MSVLLATQWHDLAQRHTQDGPDIIHCWDKIESAYSQASRAYHTLTHLSDLLAHLAPLLSQLEQPDTLLFAIFYHDIVYLPLRKDNEFQSAEVAGGDLQRLAVAPSEIARCQAHILATQHHEPTGDPDTPYLLDADLAILGAAPAAYLGYTQQIRQEYRMVPKLLYRRGRKGVIRRFLKKPNIYQTAHFRHQFENQARINLELELAGL